MKKILLIILMAFLIMAISPAISCLKTGGKLGGSDMGKVNVLIDHRGFHPDTVDATTTLNITWTNNDDVAHTVTSDVGWFDSDTILPKGNFVLDWYSSGHTYYHCKIHGSEQGVIYLH
jgi:plastocyanin